jgi:NitT/TauT family transport system substrate-binding protein
MRSYLLSTRGNVGRRARVGATLLSAALLGGSCGADAPDDALVLRVGHFPNITHAQGLIGHQLTRREKGWFEARLPKGVRVQWYVYNAGPSAMEALLAGTLDATYVGPNPALNAYVRSAGGDVRVVAGAALGGAALVVPAESGATSAADFRGKKIATPQLGNTQDVACRAWLAEAGLKVTTTGGDVNVVPTANPDQLALFQQRKLDGVWTVEPWVSRLEREAGGRVLVKEDDALTTVLVSSVRALREKRELIKALVAAHDELTRWIGEHADEARKLVQEELREETRQLMPDDLLAAAWPRIRFDARPPRAEFERFLAAAKGAGFLTGAPPLDRLVETP